MRRNTKQERKEETKHPLTRCPKENHKTRKQGKEEIPDNKIRYEITKKQIKTEITNKITK